MQNNLKSVTFFRKVFKVFSAYFLALLCGTSAGKSQILYAELYSFLQGLTCGRYCRPETPILFLSYLSAYFFAVMYLFTSATFLPVDTVLQAMPALTRRLFFAAFFAALHSMPAAFFASNIDNSPAKLAHYQTTNGNSLSSS